MAPATPIAESVQQQTAELAKGTDTVKIAETAKVAEKADSTAQPKATATATDKTYCIVLASHVRKDNAETYVEKLKKQGYNAEIYVHRNVVRVVYGSYKTEAEAYKQVEQADRQGGVLRRVGIQKSRKLTTESYHEACKMP